MRKLMLFTIGFALAVLLLTTEYSKIMVFAVAAALGISFYWKFKMKYLMKSVLFVAFGACFAVGYFQVFTHLQMTPLEKYQDETILVEAEVLDFAQTETYGYSVLVRLFFDDISGKTLFYCDEQVIDLMPGDKFWMTAELSAVDKSLDGTANTYYHSKGILLQGEGQGEMVVEKVGSVKLKHLPAYLAFYLKKGIESAFPEPYGGVVQAIVTGNRDDLTRGFSSSLERTGLTHTVAVSGMHLAFLAGMLRLILPSGRRWTCFLVIFVVVLFMFVTGCTPSVTRATIMIVMLHLAPLFSRERDDATALAMAVLLILLQNPYAISHVGLHLSVASVMGILMFSTDIQEEMWRLFRISHQCKGFFWKNFIVSAISSTFGAMVITTPFVAHYFGTVSLISPLSNLLTLWAISLIFAGGMTSALIALFLPVIGKIIALPIISIVHYLQWIIPILSRNTFAAVTMESYYYKSWLIFFYILLIIAFFAGKKSILRISLCCGAALFMFSAVLHRESYLSSSMTMRVLDVGQGQSVLFTLGNTLILSDCGGFSYENPGDVAADTIQAMGQSKLDLLVLSHCHTDHANGVVQLMDRLHVGAIAMPTADSENEVQQEILEKARETATEIWFVQEETIINLHDQRFIRIFPSVGYGDLNDTGVTLLLTAEDQDILVTGDMGGLTEEVLMETFEFPEVEIFVVGHHGSKYSSSDAFLQAIQAEIAVISVSANNRYGHPAPEVLEKLDALDITVFRTDLHGTIQLSKIG